jgi:hypothetical protein
VLAFAGLIAGVRDELGMHAEYAARWGETYIEHHVHDQNCCRSISKLYSRVRGEFGLAIRPPKGSTTFSETFQVQPTDGDLRRHVLRHGSRPVHTRSGCQNAIIKPKSRDDDKTRLIAFATAAPA